VRTSSSATAGRPRPAVPVVGSDQDAVGTRSSASACAASCVAQTLLSVLFCREAEAQTGVSVPHSANRYSITSFDKSGCGYSIFNFSSVRTIALATTQFRYHFRFAGTTYHGAQSVEVFSMACS
jgi:hypothetical protein